MKQARAWMMAAILTLSGASVFTACTSYVDNPIPPKGIAIDETNFPDPAFRNYLIETYDFAKDGILTDEEIKNTKRLFLGIDSIKSLKGIEYFTDLKKLFCFFNEITELDMSRNTKLTYLDCSNCKITKLNIANNVLLDTLYCENNELTELDISNNTELVYLDCYDNKLTQLDVSKNTALAQLDFERNQIASIDLRQNAELKELYCSGNEFTSIDLSNNPKLTLLHFYDNKISGQEMDNIINCLPQNTSGKEYEFAVYSINGEREDKNVCTKSQVEAVKAKGWTPLYFDFDEYDFINYEGSDE